MTNSRAKPGWIPADLKKHEMLVLAWNNHFFGEDFLNPVTVSNPAGPDIHLSFTLDRSRLSKADAVWFHGPTIRDMPSRSEKKQPWVLMSMESEANYPALANPVTRVAFDLLMTYRLDADIPCVYPNRNHYSFDQPAPTRRDGPDGSLAAYIASNPVAYRDDYVSELMQHMAIDSLGRCLNNRSIEDFVVGGWGDGAWSSILQVLPSYPFYLAFENSRSQDYVTERVFHSLQCGSVPVYLGAPNVLEFMPANNAVILADEFDSPEALANHLKALAGDSQAYEAHLEWKKAPFSAKFNRLLDLGDSEPRERLAIKLAHGCDRTCLCGGKQRQESNSR